MRIWYFRWRETRMRVNSSCIFFLIFPHLDSPNYLLRSVHIPRALVLSWFDLTMHRDGQRVKQGNSPC